MEKSLKRTAKNLENIGRKMSMALTAPLLTIGAIGLKTASDLQEVQNVVDVSFGKSSKIVDEWAKTTLNAYGLSELSAKRYASTLRAMTGSMGLAENEADKMSMTLAQLAGDMASFYNISTDVAFDKLRSGISGESEPLKQLGINLSVANLEAYALSKGISTAYNEMSEAEKVTLRYQYIMQTTAKAQGDFSRTSDSAANQTRLAKEQFLQTSATMMNSLLPALTMIMANVNKLLSWFNGLSGGTQEFIVKVGLLVAAIGPLLIIYAKLVKLKMILVGWYKAVVLAQILATTATSKEMAQTMANNAAKEVGLLTMIKTVAIYTAQKAVLIANTIALKLMTAAQWALNVAMSANPIVLLIAGLAALVTSFVILWNKSEGFRTFFINMWQTIGNVFKATVNGILGMINKMLNGLKTMVNGATSILNDMIKGLNYIPGVDIELIPKLDSNAIQIPKLAKGGIAYGNTIANVGEYANARSNPEVIAPLDKLKGMINDGGKNNTIIVELDGKVLTKSVFNNAGGVYRLTTG